MKKNRLSNNGGNPIRVAFILASLLLLHLLATAQTQQWLSRYDGNKSQPDIASVLVVDGAGNSYVAGYIYDSVGVQDMGQDMGVVKYDSGGVLQWAQRFGKAGIDWANALAVDAAGDVFLTGYTTDSISMVVVKYNGAGVFQWSRLFGMAGVSDEGTAVITDGSYVYVSGKSIAGSFPPYQDFLTAKFDIATGTMQPGWPQRYNGTGNNIDIPTSIAVDNSGNVFVTGSSINASGDKDYLTIAYDGAGAILPGWPARFDGPANLDDIPVQLLLSGTNIVVTGNCNIVNTTGVGDIGTIMYTIAGKIVPGWPQIYNGPANDWDGVGNTASGASFKPLAVDAAGNVYVGGWSRNGAGNYDMITFKYDPSGLLFQGWPQIYNNGTNEDITRGLAIDAAGDVCITGFSSPAGTFNNGDCVTIEYDSSGNILTGWPVFFDGPAHGDDQGQAIAIQGPSIWVTGYSGGLSSFSDFMTIKYSNSNLAVSTNDKLLAKKPVTVFPNPSNGKFIVANALHSTIRISNTLGKIVYNEKVSSEQFSVDLSSEQKEGIYFYQLVFEDTSKLNGVLIVPNY